MVNGDIEIEIGAGSETDRYAVRVLRAAAGGEPVGTLELDVEEVLSRRELLESTVLASAVTARRSVPVAEQPVREVGLQLFRALFTGPVYGMYRASLGVAQQQGKRLRVVLRLTAPELAALPWEMLFDPETETYLCRQEPLVRHVHAPYTAEPLAVRPPLRVLGLVASPRGLPMLDVEAEKSHLAEALAGPIAAGLIELVWAPEATWPGIHAQLLAGQWHVLHFVGHGDYDTRTDEGVLALVAADGRADLVEADRLADLLGEAQPTPRLVVLNSCASGRTGVNDLFSGTAAVLVRSGISAVAAMQFTISDTAAIAFARGFYTAIANGRSIDEAARSGRISILGAPSSLEWVTPVLYVRGQASQLFTLTAPQDTGRKALPKHQEIPGDRSPAPPQVTEPDRRKQAELRALYVEARAELRLEHFDTAIGLFDDLLTLDPGYADAAILRDKAQRSQQLADAYASAIAAEDADDWAAAARGYGEILQADPAYKDAADRKNACEKQQRVADLQAELRHHASAGQWQAVLDVDAELARLDTTSSDPDGLTSQARAALAAAQRTADLERRYTQARAAEDSQQWSVAINGYSEILGIDPTYRDAEARRDRCRQRSQVVVLESELEKQAAGNDSPGVLTTFKKLTDLDPAAATKPSWTAAANRARLELATHPTGPLQRTQCSGRIMAVSWHPRRLMVAVETKKLHIRVYEIPEKEPKELSAFNAGRGFLSVLGWVTFSPDGTRLATGSSDSVRIWDAASGQQLLELRHNRTVNHEAFSPDGTRLATGCNDNSARVWDAASGQQLLELRHDGTVFRVAFSPDATRLATSSNDNSARVWDAASGQQLLELRHDNYVLSLAFSPNGTRLATGCKDNSVRVWDAASGQQLLELRHDKPVYRVAFSPDGTRLATGSGDHSIRIWSVAES